MRARHTAGTWLACGSVGADTQRTLAEGEPWRLPESGSPPRRLRGTQSTSRTGLRHQSCDLQFSVPIKRIWCTRWKWKAQVSLDSIHSKHEDLAYSGSLCLSNKSQLHHGDESSDMTPCDAIVVPVPIMALHTMWWNVIGRIYWLGHIVLHHGCA